MQVIFTQNGYEASIELLQTDSTSNLFNYTIT